MKSPPKEGIHGGQFHINLDPESVLDRHRIRVDGFLS
jgi:hypothetical protein